MSLALWCNGRRDLLEFHEAPAAVLESLPRLTTLLDPAAPPADVWTLGAAGRAVHYAAFLCPGAVHGQVLALVDSSGCAVVPPVVLQGGALWFEVLTPGPARTDLLLARLRDDRLGAQVEERRPASQAAPGARRQQDWQDLVADLSPKQREAVLLAHRHGLYRSPRRATAEEVGAKLGVSRSTFEEHLRKAENKVLTNVARRMEERDAPRLQERANADASKGFPAADAQASEPRRLQ